MKIKPILINILKEIQLFKIIYNEINNDNESLKFEKAKYLLDEYKTIFINVDKGNKEIIEKWINKLNEENELIDDLKKLENYYQINNKDDLKIILKKIFIFLRKDNYYSDINSLIYFINLFEAKETEFLLFLKENQIQFQEKEGNLSFDNLVNIHNYLEEKQINIYIGKDDSALIKFVRLLYNKEDEIKFLIEK